MRKPASGPGPSQNQRGFVDIHSHILYGLDDGAKTWEDSVEMLDVAARSGTTDIVATPHANGSYEFNPGLIDQRIAELSGQVGIRIHRGCDFRLQPDNITDAIAHPAKYTINHQSYLLVEFPHLAIFSTTDEVFLQLLGADLVPIITHPERNRHLQQRIDDLARWVAMGCLVQVTAGSCLGAFGKSAATFVDALLERSLVHFVASDAHDPSHRSPNLGDAYALMVGRWGEEAIRPLFVDHPRAVINGDPIEGLVEASRGPTRRWYEFWR